MISSPIFSIPAAEEAREDAPKSHLITKKDIKRFLFYIVPVLAIVLFFSYRFMKRISDWHVCASNMNAVYKALSLYANDWDGRFPPMASSDPNTGTPYVTDGHVNTWVTQVFQYDQRPEIYHCPAADPTEGVPTEAAILPRTSSERAKRIIVYSTYGMYAGYATANESLIDRSGQSVFISETSNNGSMTSYDPSPFKDSSGAVVPYDGFSIGWDNGNVYPTPMSKMITRLAFRNSSNGDFTNAEARHDKYNLHGITPDGHLINITAPEARMNMRGGMPTGRWQVPPMAH